MSKMFLVNFADLKGALVSGLLMGLVVVLATIVQEGTIFGLNWKNIADLGILALITSFVSYLKSLLTNSEGQFLGSVKIK